MPPRRWCPNASARWAGAATAHAGCASLLLTSLLGLLRTLLLPDLAIPFRYAAASASCGDTTPPRPVAACAAASAAARPSPTGETRTTAPMGRWSEGCQRLGRKHLSTSGRSSGCSGRMTALRQGGSRQRGHGISHGWHGLSATRMSLWRGCCRPAARRYTTNTRAS